MSLFDSSIFVEVSTTVIFVLTLLLAVFLTRDYAKNKKSSTFLWSIGLWLFALGVALEVVFASGTYSELLIALYLFVVASLVNALALGSVQLVHTKWMKQSYYVYSIVTLAILAFSLSFYNIGNLVEDYVVVGLPPIITIIASSIVTIPASAILIWIAAISYLRTRNIKMISIIAGVIVVSLAGGLYITSFPAFLYYSEFIGIILLWLGFFRFDRVKSRLSSKLSTK